MTKRKNSTDRSTAIAREPLASDTVQALEALPRALQRGQGDEIVRLFFEDQAHDLFPKGQDTLKWLTNNVGKEATTKLIGAFVHLACFNCKEGLRTCENCDGAGHFDREMVCESCLGLASVLCDLCGGTGLASIDFMPLGLRLAVFAIRLENAERQIEASLKGPIAPPSKEDAAGAFPDCIDLLFSLNRQISVLESSVGVTRDMIEVPRKLKRQISKITRKAVRTAIKGEKRLGEIVETTATACKLQAENEEKGSKIQKLAAAHTNFYS